MNSGFWKDRKVLVTGHTGFKGSWLCLWLQAVGARVVGYAQPAPTHPNLFEIADIADGMTSITGDVRDLESIKNVIAVHRPEIIFHMAAQPLVHYSYQNPVETYTTNVIGTVNLLEAVRLSAGCQVVVCITSDKCYANREWHWGYREDEPFGGHDPYSSSKGCAELAIAAYRDSYFSSRASETKIASARAGNVIGGGDWAKDRLVPDIIAALAAKRPVVIRNPSAIRPWQHVLAPLSGYFSLAEKLWSNGAPFAQGWNFGPSDEEVRPVSWIVTKLGDLWHADAGWQMDADNNPHEDHYLKLDCSKARALLGWSPKLGLEATLEWIVEWHLAYLREDNMRRVSENQIRRYQELAVDPQSGCSAQPRESDDDKLATVLAPRSRRRREVRA
jgi:CDP-glucose 4,6-dehydratase